MGNDGVVIFCERSTETARGALDATLSDIGYARSREPNDVEATVFVGKGGLCLKIPLTKAFGLVLARRVARRLARPVRVFSASLVGDDPIECAVDELTLAPEGEPRQGRWGTELAEEQGDDWGALCDGKAYFAVNACLDHAVATALGEDHAGESLYLTAPRSLGAPRLDEIARQVRLADEAHLTAMAGRACVRIRTSGATVTSFLSEPEIATLRAALGPLLATK
jgi:hypothetical protein